MKKIIFTIQAVCCLCAQAQVTKIGNDTLLDIACWNVEWFGDLTNGPSNETLQYSNVKNVLKNTDVDIWGLAEVSNTNTFTTLLSDLEIYNGAVSSFSQTQKTAMIWKKSKFDLVSSGNVLTESMYNYDFAGRPPLEVVLQSKDSLNTDTLYCYILHLKANTGSQSEKVTSYNRRKNAANYLKTFLEQNRTGKKVIVLGDWNDDLDESIVFVNGAPLETPFADFITDTAAYFYPTLQLTIAGQQSTVSYNNMIDHQLITAAFKDSFYVKNSALVMTQMASQIANYANTTSDHYPVLSRYNMNRYKQPKPLPTGLLFVSPISVSVYPNPAVSQVFIQSPFAILHCMLTNVMGQQISITLHNNSIDVSSVSEGFYTLLIETEKGRAKHKLWITH